MKMEYFTENGVKQVIAKYRNEIGNEFYFDDSNIKHKLTDIVSGASICNNGFLILFQSDKGIFTTIYNFMLLNKLVYKFHDFDTTSIELI